MFSEEKLYQAGKKKQTFYSNFLLFFTHTHRTVWNMKKLHQEIICKEKQQ